MKLELFPAMHVNVYQEIASMQTVKGKNNNVSRKKSNLDNIYYNQASQGTQFFLRCNMHSNWPSHALWQR